ncbi:TRL-like family protein [Leptospira yanagawae serovar Saopaulo str. Sao Paulo = ATCC 700523]|uniref:TRL-like family protein n=1 Tax=Leptospira yanagawae serovar Saopaulo str. Sao Paulo = ATCC 700523 TaxID=1249483 RepID=A0A5E8HGF4_9LEPT|nr:TRL domain-containing protein [Leptospira yanagawae]EOQ89708.1 TRL-like family protein [Leptospira yanagawae serovar Saopaulo str. Sao Paulo = ATCC 700523]
MKSFLVKIQIFWAFSFFIIFHSSCANFGQPQGIGPTGLLYASYTLAVSERPLPKQPLKVGKSCLKRIGFFYVTGDASISAAASVGNIQEVFRIEKEATNYLSLYSTLCTVVGGI